MASVRNILFFILLQMLLFSSCSHWGGGESDPPGVGAFVKGDTVSRTLLVYIMAENSISDDLQSDFDEIKRAASEIPDDMRLFVYFDNSDATRLPFLSQYNWCNGELVEDVVYAFDSDVCSSDTAVLGKVLDAIFNDYPTRTFDLILGSHASGWIRKPSMSVPNRTIGIDNGKNTYSDRITETIEVEELAALLERQPVKVDRLMFDACLMQGVEVAYALRNVADWIIASPAEIPSYGAPYDKVVPEFLSPFSSVEDIMYEYKVFYDNMLSGVVLSAVCTSHMQELAEVTRGYVEKYFAAGTDSDYEYALAYLPGGAYRDDPRYPSYYDFNSVMKVTLDTDEYAGWKAVLEKAVPLVMVSNSRYIYSGIAKCKFSVDVNECGGISMYLPLDNKDNYPFNEEFRTIEWYNAAGWDAAGW